MAESYSFSIEKRYMYMYKFIGILKIKGACSKIIGICIFLKLSDMGIFFFKLKKLQMCFSFANNLEKVTVSNFQEGFMADVNFSLTTQPLQLAHKASNSSGTKISICLRKKFGDDEAVDLNRHL